MNEPIKYIAKVEIKNLWGRYDIEWNLDPSVNVLSGINGSGKSTVLNCILNLVVPENRRDEMLADTVSVTFNNNSKIEYQIFKNTVGNLEILAQDDNYVYELLSSIKKEKGEEYKKIVAIDYPYITLDNKPLNEKIIDELYNHVIFAAIKSFDKPINPNASPDVHIKTELDRDIFELQRFYLDYQLNIGKKAFEIITKNAPNAHDEVLLVKEQQERLIEIIDLLFKTTGKSVDRNSNELAFIIGGRRLTPYQLSSGEKQILKIFLRVLIQNNRPTILFMDEPEISLHLDWQRKLIQYIKELNPNVQIILATHSPGIILEGWSDKVSEMSDLITHDRQAKLENAK
jgi:predicted ATP-dependent endonuclease of OLD family